MGTRNEIVGLIKHRPHLIMMPHVRYERDRPVLEYAKAQGTAVAVLPVEGLANTPRLVAPSLGSDGLRPMVDLYMSWGKMIAQRCQNEGLAPNAEVHIVGSPRFDLHSADYDPVFPSRREFCERIGFSPERPLVSWFSCLGRAPTSR